MIKANELRIGNWVNHLGTASKIMRGAQIDKNADELNPILLTPEILEKCGFVNDGRNDVLQEVSNSAMLKLTIPRPDGQPIPNEFEFSALWLKEEAAITVDYTVQGFWAAKKIKYLHQLQNLFFALTCEELEIKTLPNDTSTI